MEKSELMKSIQLKDITLKDFKFLKLLGSGASGKVYLAEFIKNKELYVIKSIRKDKLLGKESFSSIKAEKEILLKVNHPNLISMHCLF